MSVATILLVDDDEVLRQVLRRVLSRDYQMIEAGTVAEALEQVRDHTPQLGLLDFSLPDGDGLELAKKLRTQGTECPLILFTAYPLRLRDEPELGNVFARIITKPVNLQDLRETIDRALNAPAAAVVSTSEPPSPLESFPQPAPPISTLAPRPELPTRARGGRLRGAVLAGAVLVGVAFFCLVVILPALGLPGLGEWFGKAATPTAAASEERGVAASLVNPDPSSKDFNSMQMAPEVVERLGVKTVVAERPMQGQDLVMSGSLNLDPDYLAHVHSLFPGEVMAIGKYKPEGAASQGVRPLQRGDTVQEGDLLAVIWSKDLGEKKNDLIEGLAKYWTDKESLVKLGELYRDLATSEANVRLQRGVVAADLSAVDRARNALRIWGLTKEQVDAVEKEAQAIFDERTRLLNTPGEKKTPQAGNWENWARLEVKAKSPGVIVERNIANKGENVDNSTDLFKIADMTHLVVYAHAYENDLPLLLNTKSLPRPIPWTVHLTSDPDAKDRDGRVLDSPGAEEIGPIIDPNQHTALVVGKVNNADRSLRAGEFVTATINLPPPDDVVAVPSTAMVDYGDGADVFVQPDPKTPRFTLKRVKVTRRTQEWIWVLAKQDGKGANEKDNKEDFQRLEQGERVVADGAVMLKSTLEDLQDKAKAEAKTSTDSRPEKK